MAPDRRDNTESDPLWYKDAIIYELHIKSFFDRNDDGMGDFGGLLEKLDYLEYLGVNAVWLLPFYPSPLRDDGYDIADYFDIHPDYGTKQDFRRFLKEAHKRGIRVITELVINHTSDQHPWFQRARRSKPGSSARDFYVWTDDPHRYGEARVIFGDFESSNWSWDPEARAYYWHRFYHHQPDLNYDNPRVQKEIFRVLDYWFGMGVDGLRLDAVPYLFEREGTNCENLPETHEFLKKLRAHIDERHTDKMLLAEANQWPEDAAAYFGDEPGDECHMAFHFPVMPRLFMALRREDRFPIVDILEQTMDIPSEAQWAMFLRNHDELTLEMVTDEERDYMHKVYAEDPRARINLGIRRRLAPLLENNRRKIELMNMLLLSLPGTPVIYYGDELGMGDNYYLGDRDGVRTPMQWSPDRNAGFSKANPHRLYLPVIIDSEYHFAAVNVENQQKNASSLLWWMKRIISIRKQYKAFGRGDIRFLLPENPRVLVFTRTYEDQTLLVVANLSRFCQMVQLDLREYEGWMPVEVFSSNHFSRITRQPYPLTLGPHSFFWFVLEKAEEPVELTEPEKRMELQCRGSWKNLSSGAQRRNLEEVLFRYLSQRRWFGGKSQKVRTFEIADAGTIPGGTSEAVVVLLRVSYVQADDELYQIPIAFARRETSLEMAQRHPEAILAHLSCKEGDGVIYEAIYEQAFRNDLLGLIGRNGGKSRGRGIVGLRGRGFRAYVDTDTPELPSRVLKAEQSNTSILYGEEFFLKLYRKLEMGMNPDVELNEALTNELEHIDPDAPFLFPPYAGQLQWKEAAGGQDLTIALLQGQVPNQSDGWTYTLDAVGRYVSVAQTHKGAPDEALRPSVEELQANLVDVPDALRDMMDVAFLANMRLLGVRTAQMHKHLAGLSRTEQRAFRLEPFSMLYQRSVVQSMSSLTRKVLRQLRSSLENLPENVRGPAEQVLKSEKQIISRFQALTKKKFSAMKIRIHGDYHLGQVLFTGKDFVIIDFEGEPARPLSERRIKRSAIRDVAGMIKSFHYAGQYRLYMVREGAAEEVARLEPWVELWYEYVSGLFLNAYLQEVGEVDFLPSKREDFDVLLNAFLLEKAVYELGYELDNRPAWMVIPMNGIFSILNG